MKSLQECYADTMDNFGRMDHELSRRGMPWDEIEPVLTDICKTVQLALGPRWSNEEIAAITMVGIAVGIDWEREVANEARAMLGEMKL